VPEASGPDPSRKPPEAPCKSPSGLPAAPSRASPRAQGLIPGAVWSLGPRHHSRFFSKNQQFF